MLQAQPLFLDRLQLLAIPRTLAAKALVLSSWCCCALCSDTVCTAACCTVTAKDLILANMSSSDLRSSTSP